MIPPFPSSPALLFLRISPRMGLAWGVLLFSPPLSAANARSMQGCWNSTVASSMSMEFTLQRWPPFFVVGIPGKSPVKQHEGHKKRSKGTRSQKWEKQVIWNMHKKKVEITDPESVERKSWVLWRTENSIYQKRVASPFRSLRFGFRKDHHMLIHQKGAAETAATCNAQFLKLDQAKRRTWMAGTGKCGRKNRTSMPVWLFQPK